jgi:hypothetical protein
MTLLTPVFHFKHLRDVHVHELHADGEAATCGDLNAACRHFQFGILDAHPTAERVAPEVLNEVLHADPLKGEPTPYVGLRRCVAFSTDNMYHGEAKWEQPDLFTKPS